MKFSLCRHRRTYIERRPLAGATVAVLHFVCHDCGRAHPMMQRTVEEHERALGKVTTHRKPMIHS